MSRRKRAREIAQQALEIDQAPTPERPEHGAAPVAAICVLLVVVSVVAFWGVLSNAFVIYDDDVYVTENAQVQQGITLDNVKWAFTTTYFGFYYPVTWLSHMLDCQLYGLDAGKHHFTSLLIHSANAVLLFLLLLRMTGALWRCALVAGLFALHPLHVESVAWIAERKDVLSTLFWMLTLLAWLGYVKSKSWQRYAVVLVLFALGLMAKSMLVTLPFLLLLLDYWPLGRLKLKGEWLRTLRGLVLEKAPLFAMSAVSCVVTVVAQRSAGAMKPLEDFPISERLANAALTYVSYLAKTVWPASLAVFYPHPHVGLFTWRVCGSVLLLAAMTILALVLARRVPYIAAGWLWYLGALVPVIGLVQVGVQASADRYTYVPLVGIFIVTAWGLTDLCRGSRAARHALAVLACACLVVFLFVTRTQVKYWKDSTALFGHALAVTSNNYVAHTNLGVALFAKGRAEEAIAQCKEAVRIAPKFCDALNNLGVALGSVGRSSEAIEYLQRAVEACPDFADAHNNLGHQLANQGRFEEAIAQYEEAVRTKPNFCDALDNLGVALGRAGRSSEAIDRLQRAVQACPDSADLQNNLGIALSSAGQPDAAVEHYKTALRLNPNHADAHYNLANTLSDLGQLDAAEEQYKESLRIKPDAPKVLTNYGLVLIRANRLPEAVDRLGAAVKLDPGLVEAQFNLGLALAREHRLPEAMEHFRETVRLKPDYEQARENLEKVQRILRDRSGHTPP